MLTRIPFLYSLELKKIFIFNSDVLVSEIFIVKRKYEKVNLSWKNKGKVIEIDSVQARKRCYF